MCSACMWEREGERERENGMELLHGFNASIHHPYTKYVGECMGLKRLLHTLFSTVGT